MMDFLSKKAQQNKKIGTPTKKRKLNNDQQSDVSDFDIPLHSLVFVRNISNTDNQNIFSNRQKDMKISDFTVGQAFMSFGEDKQNNKNFMNIMQSQEDQIKIPIKLGKKLTHIQKYTQKEYDNIMTELSLTRNNSTFPITRFAQQHHEQIGQNVYLTQLLNLKSKISMTDANNNNRQLLRNSRNQTCDQENRLEKDYQIKQNLGKYQPNKQGFICLNKLQKIFYYVKKINIKNRLEQSQKNHFSFINRIKVQDQTKKSIKIKDQTKEATEQIKLYNKDEQGHLLRFYQQWKQNKSIYMIYQLGTYSLADRNLSYQKISQSQIWSVLIDSVQSLKWIYCDQDKVHMNIKPGNIIKCRNKYKLADPYTSMQAFQPHLISLNTRRQHFYLAPELIEFKNYLDGIDYFKCQIYSLGMCILQNITGMPDSLKNQSMGQIKKYFKKQMHGYSSYLRKLLLRMIQKNSNKRPTLEQLTHNNLDQFQQKINSKIIKQTNLFRSKSV